MENKTLPAPLYQFVGRLTIWDRILILFGIKVTWEWCLVGCTIGRHSWSVSLEKCRNGTPVISGWFLDVYKCRSKHQAEEMLPEFLRIADNHNAKHGYAREPANPKRSGPTTDAASKPDVAGSADAKLMGNGN